MVELTLGFPFSDHLVLQRERANPIWGRDRPRQEVSLCVEGAGGTVTAHTEADATGAFRCVCPPLPAGGPYRVIVTGSTRVVLDDVVVGEVWLVSGQSNMEFALSGVLDADSELERANHPGLRVLKVERQTASEPLASAAGEWSPATPESSRAFSAIGYFFARELHQRLGVPVGLIDATWGGTRIAAWTSVPALRALDPEVDARLAALCRRPEDLAALQAEYGARLAAWEREVFPADPPISAAERGFADPSFDDGAWGTLPVPAYWQHHGMHFNGVVWYRTRLELPTAWAGRELTLSLGAIDDFDHTYFNGELVGAHPSGTPLAHQLPRRYIVPGHLVRPGTNVLAVRVFDHFGEGGFVGPKRALRVAPSDTAEAAIPLPSEWRAFAAHPIPTVAVSRWDTRPEPPPELDPKEQPGALFNGMISPLIPYGLRGFLWYQGESDTARHARYARDQLTLIRDLRSHFAQGQLPFFLVELAGFDGGPDWPFLREAQQQATWEPHTGLATARDVGDPTDIHPRNKQEVARRLALLARARVYGENVEDSGPTLRQVTIDGAQARVSFRHAAGLRSRRPDRLGGFELAGGDGRFFPAAATLEGDSVVLTAAEVPAPVHVRYAFTATGEGDLENAAGLPALSFRTDGAAPG